MGSLPFLAIAVGLLPFIGCCYGFIAILLANATGSLPFYRLKPRGHCHFRLMPWAYCHFIGYCQGFITILLAICHGFIAFCWLKPRVHCHFWLMLWAYCHFIGYCLAFIVPLYPLHPYLAQLVVGVNAGFSIHPVVANLEDCEQWRSAQVALTHSDQP